MLMNIALNLKLNHKSLPVLGKRFNQQEGRGGDIDQIMISKSETEGPFKVLFWLLPLLRRRLVEYRGEG